jgi:pilus assembly protein Flp/PilA
VRRVGHDDQGASAVEYSLLLTAIAAVIVIVVFALGGLVRDVFQDTCSMIDARSTANASC